AGYFAIAALPARYALERGSWQEAASLDVHQSAFLFADAMTYFARALGAARIGDAAASAVSLAALGRLSDQLLRQNESYWSAQVDIQQRGASAWLALAEGRNDQALAGMRDTADREDATEKNAITPGPLAASRDRKSTRLNSSHPAISYAVFYL